MRRCQFISLSPESKFPSNMPSKQRKNLNRIFKRDFFQCASKTYLVDVKVPKPSRANAYGFAFDPDLNESVGFYLDDHMQKIGCIRRSLFAFAYSEFFAAAEKHKNYLNLKAGDNFIYLSPTGLYRRANGKDKLLYSAKLLAFKSKRVNEPEPIRKILNSLTGALKPEVAKYLVNYLIKTRTLK